jgi:outer membrane immunogenic protein
MMSRGSDINVHFKARGREMRKFLLATSALAALVMAAPAGAADMAVKARPLPPTPPPCAQFGGVYVGGYAGGALYEHNWTDLDDFADEINDQVRVGHAQFKNSGFIGGVQTGWNWQSRCAVFGVQVDYGWSGIEASTDFTSGSSDSALRASLTITSKLRGIGTVRTRTGLVVDNLLLYVTGGFAWAKFDRGFTALASGEGGLVTEAFSYSTTNWGWVAGVGYEWSLWSNWSLQGELLYAQFQKERREFNCGTVLCFADSLFRIDVQDSVWIGKISIGPQTAHRRAHPTRCAATIERCRRSRCASIAPYGAVTVRRRPPKGGWKAGVDRAIAAC